MASTNSEYNFEFPCLITEVDAVAFIRLTKTNDQNTKPEQNSTGRAILPKTVQFGSTTNFNTTVKFKITPDPTLPPGDGLAFFIVPEGHVFPPPTGGNLGIFGPGETSVFAVALDLRRIIENDHPNLAIYIGSRVPKNLIQVPDDILGKQLEVSYDAKTGEIIAIFTDSDGKTYEVSYQYQLSQFLPSRVSVGLASSTSKAAAIHDVNNWAFFIDGQ